jgi:hypothetical protein
MTLARIAALLIGLSLAAGCADRPSRDGLYSDVTISGETGDESGAILYFEDGEGEPRVRFDLCEGECLDHQALPAKVDGDVVTFTSMDEGPGPVRFQGVFEKGGVTLTSPDQPWLNRFLPRIKDSGEPTQ